MRAFDATGRALDRLEGSRSNEVFQIMYDFEDSLSNIASDWSNFTQSDWSTSTEHVKHGSQALQNGTPDDPVNTPADGSMPEYFDQGQMWSCYIHPNAGWTSDEGIYFRVNDSGDRWIFRFESSGNDVELIRPNITFAGTATLDSSTLTDEWTEWRVTDDDGTLGGSANDITAEILDESGTQQASISVNNNANNDHDGVGIIGQGGDTHFDAWVRHL